MTRQLPSDAEIAVLEALAAQGETLAAKSLSSDATFRTWLLFVDPGRQYLVLARSGDAAADAAFLKLPHTELIANWQEWRIAFSGEGPEPYDHEGIDAIWLRFPESVSISRRRLQERVAVPENAPLRCVAYSGATAIFEASVTDVSVGGIGIQFDSVSNALEPGMVLSHCHLMRGEREPAVIDLEVRHTSSATLPDGRKVARAGCRFVNLSPEATALVAELVRD